MAFFPRTFYNTEASFTPLFRLLDDFDTYSRSGSNSNGTTRSHISHWQPKFDVRETSDAFHFHGELPGLTKDEISIEFPEHQSMTIRGKTERTYTSGTPPAGLLESTNQDTPAAVTEAGERRNSHQATVEDEANAERSDNTAVAAPDNDNNNSVAKADLPADNSKYWLTERSIGEFSRHFSFPSRINPDGVTASLKEGILTIDVPKAKKHESRRVAVN
ncbi:unnamed protein product [Clonostachys rosea f. rosea IK726]|jgi:HSP20 family molecular chaperone IbpA|uniref:SHSP domain-containing protein n=2 Tax=Bionectria ochroleuca TaxID=29856 RepID=A0A0B7K7B4_BIOOC|nr:unnamed protein product [Clonostachys rosea f. rosea IK726]